MQGEFLGIQIGVVEVEDDFYFLEIPCLLQGCLRQRASFLFDSSSLVFSGSELTSLLLELTQT